MAESTPIIIEPPQNFILKGSDAKVSVGTGYSFPFGNGKVSVSVTLSCSQDQETIERAGEAAMSLARGMALEYMNKVAQDLSEGVGQPDAAIYDPYRKG